MNAIDVRVAVTSAMLASDSEDSDHSIRHALLAAILCKTLEGTILSWNAGGASKVARNVSERKRVEQALQERERRLKTEVDALAKLNEWSTRGDHHLTKPASVEAVACLLQSLDPTTSEA